MSLTAVTHAINYKVYTKSEGKYRMMSPSRPKPSEIAAEAKRVYHPYIERKMPECPARSFLVTDSTTMPVHPGHRNQHWLRVAVIDGDPVDVAIDWYHHTLQDPAKASTAKAIPVVNMANEKRAGGDWESGLMAPEECFARRSNLVHGLVSAWDPYNPPSTTHYPIPQKGGLYTPHVVVYRDGPEHYQIWQEFRSLPVISVAPVRRPKLDETGTTYSFEQERELMLEKMRTVLRMAAMWHHRDLCLGAFGCGPASRNPIAEVAKMWRQLLFDEEEFKGVFENIVFAIETNQPGNPKGGEAEFQIFQQEFDPSNVFPTAYR